MSFNFGNTSGFPAANTAAQPGFGLGAGNSAPANKTPFGSTSFSFGAPTAATAAPTFNLGGTTATTASSFGFGGLTSTATPAATGFGGFGGGFGTNPGTATTTTLTPGTGFGTGTGFTGFGAPTTSTPSTSFGFGSSFGAAPATSAAPGSLFSGFGQTGAANTGFGQTNAANTGFGGFGSTFGAKPAATNTGFSGFGSSLTGSSFGQGLNLQQQQQQQQQQQAASNPNDALYNAIFNCSIYGDERDATLARWNLLQALWGTGKGYYSQNAPPVDFTLQNPFCRFKAIGYSVMPTTENKEGLVAITFNKSEGDIRTQQQQLVSSLSVVLGNKPNLSVTVDGIKPMSESKAQVVFYVQEKGATGSVRRIPATELSAFLLQPMQKQQLTSMGAENIYPQVATEKDQLSEYLENPPAGIDPRLWKQAQSDNPDPSRYIPVPMVGFGEVRWRMKCQEQETKLHQAFLDRVAEDIAELKRRHSGTVAKLTEYRRKFVELEHRVLQVLVKQEVCRKVGMALQPEEEVLKSQLESLQIQLSAPTQFKGRLNEMLSQLRMHRHEVSQQDVERYSMDPAVRDDIKQFLAMEQNGMAHLVDTINTDMANLRLIKDGMMRLLQGH